MTDELRPNESKSLTIEVDGQKFERLPIKTKLVTRDDDIVELCAAETQDLLQPGDVLFISEKIVAITQGRAFKVADIKPSRLANFLQKFVTKTPAGIGLGSPATMHLAIKEVGAPRIILAAAIAAVTKPLGIKGVFYRVAGKRAAGIDGPCDYTIPPYNKYASLTPKNPDKVARQIKDKLGNDVIIIDANDLGVDILGRSSKDLDKKLYRAVFKDNPIGQTNEQTPLCILRKI